MPRGEYKLYRGAPFLDPGGFSVDPRRWWDDEPLLDIKPWHPALFWKYLVHLAVWDHKGRRVRRGGEIVLVERGQFYHSLRFVGERPGWSKEKVRRELARLQEEGRISCAARHGGTLVTITHYDPYQDIDWYLGGNENSTDSASNTRSLTPRRHNACKPTRETRRNEETTPPGVTSRKKAPLRRETRRDFAARRDADETNKKSSKDSTSTTGASAATRQHQHRTPGWTDIRAAVDNDIWRLTPASARRQMIVDALQDEMPPRDLAPFVRDQCAALDLPFPDQLLTESGEAPATTKQPTTDPDHDPETRTRILADQLREKLERLKKGTNA